MTGWNWPSGSGQEDKKTKMLKVYNNNNDNAEKKQTTNFDWKSSLEIWGSGELIKITKK